MDHIVSLCQFFLFFLLVKLNENEEAEKIKKKLFFK